ncbi:hypothetical protein BZG36_03100 [Bifiguratus adelaidae]|uniref:LisH domain-containing protein n=1 Tax=Bifiguratus adelaidae TaxID=1938954 RepID=A0A261XZ04_9FUNG|nr:hypothetical protein BZG36_03100 [Bifiguratus adelaidae]
MSITSEEVNYLIYRYLFESGFVHTSFTFQNESHIHKSEYKNANVEPGALIRVLQKGLQYMDVEAHLNEDGSQTDCNVPLTLIGPHRCDILAEDGTNEVIDRSVPATKREDGFKKERDVREKDAAKRGKTDKDRRRGRVISQADGMKEDQQRATSASPNPTPSISSKSQRKRTREDAAIDRMDVDDSGSVGGADIEINITETNSINGSDKLIPGGESAIEEGQRKLALKNVQNAAVIGPENLTVLEGHEHEVFSCSWNPVLPYMVASGSADGTARLWQVPATSGGAVGPPIVLNHLPSLAETKDVTALDWNPAGTLLATGSYDGQARIWTPRGELRWVMSQHRGPVFSVKWNPAGTSIVSGSADNTTIVWDAETGNVQQQFEFHSLAILDVDWMDDRTFASCSSDKMVQVCQFGQNNPVKTWTMHEDEVNAVRWDPTKKYLASCSDDGTAKIWSMSSDKPIHDLRGHRSQIYTLQWAPTTFAVKPDASLSSNGYHGDTPKAVPILATASFDATIRLWDAEHGTCLRVLSGHTEAVYSITFSPDSKYLASGGFDNTLNLWNTEDGALTRAHKGAAGIFEVHFNTSGDKLAACTSNMQLIVVDIKSL